MSGTRASARRVLFGRTPPRLTVGARLLVGAALALVCAAAGAPPAQAHTSLVGMTPSNGSTVSSAPTQVVLTFDEAVEQVGDAVVVTAPSGARVGAGAPVVDGSNITQQLTPLTETGRYTVAFRMVSDDGHPVTGTQSFTLEADGGSSPPDASSSTSASLGSSPDTASVPVAPIVAGSVALLVLGAAAALVGRRRARG